MTETIRIGSRNSELALLQANKVYKLLKNKGQKCIIVPVKSSGDIDLISPIYSMGIQGVFTKALDIALLNNKIDIAVHSLKDIPTLIPEGIHLSAILERDEVRDSIIYSNKFADWKSNSIIASGSLRRKAQWLRKHPTHKVVNVRGNIHKRIEKLNNSSWGALIIAQAAIKRLGVTVKEEVLQWMIPAPGQGVIGICSLIKDEKINKLLKTVNCSKTETCVTIEREFLKTLEGGCTAPIGAYCRAVKNKLIFESGVFSLDGSEAIYSNKKVEINNSEKLGVLVAKEILQKGARKLLSDIKNKMP
jgi:hydroxymethylbilane synthase